ncbi:MAG: 50S ribosomal protein L23 [Chloroflexi bacterium]|nr:50S ribosomal protein L23 [Chloroflexota bacterium]
MHLYEVLRRPLVTEKNTDLQAQGKYSFEVARGANKHQIKEAVETAFSVTVLSVNVLNLPGKKRRVAKGWVETSPTKKAVVTLKPGDSIQFFEGA